MKRRIHWNWNLGLALAVLPFIGGHPQDSYSQATNTVPVVEAEVTAEASAEAAPAEEPIPTEGDLVDAPDTPITTEKPLPPGIQTTGPVNDVLKLVESGVDEGVLLAYVTNSTGLFGLRADEIIYLNDIGVPSAVVTAMIERDQALKALATNAVAASYAPAPVAPPPAAAEVAPVPAPGEIAPQPDYTAGTYAATTDAAYAPFYDSLAPYGTWVDIAGYGPCWQPSIVVINPTWQPYCDGGSWTYTDCGWYWLSGYSWGWAPFHYGRWFQHSRRGWCWRPGTTWGPSWVCWRYNSSYCGWAPLPPAAGFTAGVGLTFHGQHVSASFGFGLGVGSYTFVPVTHFAEHHPGRYAVPHQRATQVYKQTTPSVTIAGHGTRVVNHGIPVSQVANASGTQIRMRSVREGTSPGGQGGRGERFESRGGTVSGYRPHFSQPRGTQAPSRGFTQPGANGASTLRPLPANRTADSTVRHGEPLILRGADRSRESTTRSSVGAAAPATPAGSLVIIGRREANRTQTARRTPSSPAESSWQRPSAPQQNTFSRPARIQRPQETTSAVTSSHSQRVWSAPRAAESQVRAERPPRITVPSHSTPMQVPRNTAPAASTRRETRALSLPRATPIARPTAPQSRPTYSAPSRSFAPAAPPHSSSAAPTHSHSSPSSSGSRSSPFSPRNGR